MNRKFMFGSAALMLALGFTACSSQEDALQTADEVLTEDANFFFNISIANPSEDGSRADVYDEGTTDEQKINSILFTFYNSQNGVVGSTTIRFDGAPNPEGTDYSVNGSTWQSTGQPVHQGTDKNTITTVIVPVKVDQGSTKPTKVIAVINRGPLNTAFDAIDTYTKEKVTLDQAMDNGFMMSSSVYYDTNSKEAKIAADIDEACIYKTSEAAKAGSKSADIYVERVVAKVKTRLAKDWAEKSSTNWVREWDETGDVNDSKSGYKMVFKAISWALSNNEKESFLIKNFRSTSDFTNQYMTRDEATAAFDEALPDWNSPALHRSFWAMSPSYFGCSVPKNDTDNLDKENRSYLEYLTRDEVLAGNELSTTYNSVYSLEHTHTADVVTSYKNKLVSAAIMVGQYVKGDNYFTGAYSDKVPDFYLRRFTSANDASTQVMVYDTEEKLIKAFFAANETNPILMCHYSGPSGIGWGHIKRDYQAFIDKFEIKHYDNGNYSYYVTLQLKEDAKIGAVDNVSESGPDMGLLIDHTGEELNDYALISSKPEETKRIHPEYKVISIAQANRYIAEHFAKTEMGYVEKYDKGLAYFAMPVEHLWAWKNTKSIGDDEFKAVLGQYGIVRNHIYSLEILSFQGIGKPVPIIIVPETENEKYYVRTRVNINRWRLVPTQSEVLRP